MDSAILAHFMLKEKLQKMGMLGCLLCIVGSTIIVLHAPEERSITSVEEIWELATQPGGLLNFSSDVKCLYCLIFSLHNVHINLLFVFFVSSLSFVYSFCNSYCAGTNFVLCSPLWSN